MEWTLLGDVGTAQISRRITEQGSLYGVEKEMNRPRNY
jgi:hypothetical protein